MALTPPPPPPLLPQIGGWLTPILGCIEMTQCLVQAVPLGAKKQSPISEWAPPWLAGCLNDGGGHLRHEGAWPV